MSGHDDASVGQHLKAHGVGEQGRLLEFLFLLLQAEIDLEHRRLVKAQASKPAPQRAHRFEPGDDRLQCRTIALGVERLLRCLRGRRDRGKAVDQVS